MNTQNYDNSKSLLTSIKTGFDSLQDETFSEKIITYKEDPNLCLGFNSGFDKPEKKEEIPLNIEIISENCSNSKESILNDILTGFSSKNQIIIEKNLPPIIIEKPEELEEEIPKIVITQSCKKPNNKDSVIENIETGFGSCNKLHLEHKKPKYKTHLFKENYLSEFKSDFEKKLVRDNLNIYSKEEVNNIFSLMGTSHLITKELLDLTLLNYTTSKLNATIDYKIPNNLFNK